MRVMAIDLRRLRHVVEVARAEGITPAAHTLHITQSALTRSIADVEAEVGVELFQRLPRGVRVTDAGRTFVEKAQRILADADELIASISEMKTLKSGILRMGIAPAAYRNFVGDGIAAFASSHPGIAIEVYHDSVHNLAPRVVVGELDLVIAPLRQLERWSELSVLRIADFHCIMLLRPDHPLASAERVTEADVLSYPAVIPTTMDPMLTDIAQIYARNGLTRFQPRYRVDGFSLVRRLVRATDAYAPIVTLDQEHAYLRREFLVFEDVVRMPSQSLAVAGSGSRGMTPAASGMFEVLRDHFLHTIRE